MQRDEVAPEAEQRENGPARPRGELRSLAAALERGHHAAAEGGDETDLLQERHVVAVRQAPDDGDAGGDGRERDDDADRARRHAAVEGDEAQRPEDGGKSRPRHLGAGRSSPANRHGDSERGEPERL